MINRSKLFSFVNYIVSKEWGVGRVGRSRFVRNRENGILRFVKYGVW